MLFFLCMSSSSGAFSNMSIKDTFFGVKKLCFLIIYRTDTLGKAYKYCINLLFFLRS